MLEEYIVLKAKESTYTIGIIAKTILFTDYLQKNIQIIQSTTDYVIKIKKKFIADSYLTEQMTLSLIYDYIEYFCRKIQLDLYSEIDIIENIFSHKGNHKIEELKSIISQKLRLFIEKVNVLNIDSFVIFAIKEYDTAFLDIIFESIDELEAEEDLCDFIDMLKFYINTEPNKIDKINIDIKPDGTYNYYDSNFDNLSQILTQEFYRETLEFNATSDEILMSILITNHPGEIIIHNIDNASNVRLLRTLKSVFENRIKVCTDKCNFCDE